jgi:flagellar M-ring protein FliF
MNIWWGTLDRRARLGLLASAAAVVLLFVVAAWWLFRAEQAVLFSDLRPQDASTMAAELDKLKIPYAVAEGGSALLVDASQVHAVRLKLMGRELPLNGTVGLELFNHVDFGMTEFAQRINYQRALQGELTRTILSFQEVRDARVHLALPEQGLFKQNAARPKAAITLAVRPGHALRPEQVHGIQRLVAAAVPALSAGEVTIVDQHGAALNRSSDIDGETAAGGMRLDLKRDTENYLSRKAGLVLDKTFGPGQALASVDVTLNMDQVRVTTEDVIAAPDGRGGAAGVLVRERESARDSTAPDTRAARGSSMQRDVEYQTGRRVEHVVSHPGAIRRLHVVAVVRQNLPEDQREQVHRVVAAAVGANPERGDTVVVQTLPRLGAPELAQTGLAVKAMTPAPTQVTETPATVRSLVSAALALTAIACIGLLAVRRRRAARMAPAALTEAQRQAALQRVQGWLLQSGCAVDAAALSRREAD